MAVEIRLKSKYLRGGTRMITVQRLQMGRMSDKRHRNRKDESSWRWRHVRKRVYRTRFQAWRAVLRLWIRQRHWDSLKPYECRMGDVYELRNSYPLHYHIGHGKRGLPDRLRYRCCHLLVYPYRRLRSGIRLKIRTRNLRARRPPQRRRKRVRATRRADRASG